MASSRARSTGKGASRTYATGGGDATASGVAFQQSLGALFGLWMLTETSIDPGLGLGAVKVTTLRMETEAPLDDALALTSAGGVISAQAKRNLSLSFDLASEFGKTVEQLVRQWLLCLSGDCGLGWDRPLDQGRDRLLVVVGPDSPATTRIHLARALDARRQPGGKALLTTAESAALERFDGCVRLAWAASTPEPLLDATLLALSCLTFVYTLDPAGVGRAALVATLGPAVADPADAPSVLNLLERVAGDLMGLRGGHNIATLRADLVGRGARLTGRPDYRCDISALAVHSALTEQALRATETVEAEAGVPVGIIRHCQPAVDAAALGGDLLLVGEPGTGKSAVLGALGRSLRELGHDVVELAVDRFSVESLEGLSRALGLGHDLPEVLATWDGLDPAFLLIDALDAGRGGPAEGAFRRLVHATVERKGRWRVVASIRTFDLVQGRGFRTLFAGLPPQPTLCAEGLRNVRHIQVPAWSDAEFAELLKRSPRLAEVLRGCPGKVRQLAMVPFNTRLIAELVASGALAGDLTLVSSQAALLDLYWDWRVRPLGTAAEICLRGVVGEMVSRRELKATRLAAAAAEPAALDGLVGADVLASVERERFVQFRHHLLFDYVASRVHLDGEAIADGTMDFPRAGGLGFVLGPAAGFLLQELWSCDPDRERFWRVTTTLLGTPDCDPVIRSIAARTAAESAVLAADIVPFARAVFTEDALAAAALNHLAAAVAVELEDRPDAPLAPWVRLVLELSSIPGSVFGVLRMLVYVLVDRVRDPALRAELGTAVRALLDHGYGLDQSRQLATPMIGFVADTLVTDVGASTALLRRVLSEERFGRFGPEECPALARKIQLIAEASPGFAAEVYEGIFARRVTEDRKTSLGGGSRILNLTSNARQDFEGARWALKEYFPRFLAASPVEATRALLGAVEGFVNRRHPLPADVPEHVIGTPWGTVRMQADLSHVWAHKTHPQYATDAEALLSRFETFLETGPEDAVMAAAEHAIRNATLAVFWSRMFMAAAVRGGTLAGLLVRCATLLGPLLCLDTMKDAIDLVAAAYGSLERAERVAFEEEMLGHGYEEFSDPAAARTRLLARLFGRIGAGFLETDCAKQAIAGEPSDVSDNPRLFRIITEWAERDDYRWLDEAIRSRPETVATLLSLDTVREELRLRSGDERPPGPLQRALAALANLSARLLSGNVPDGALFRHVQDVFAEGVHSLVNSGLIGPETDVGTVGVIVGWIETAYMSAGPELDLNTEAAFEDSPDWFSPSGRIEAAGAALDMLLRRPEAYPLLEPLIGRALGDAHPAVRMVTGRSLVRIWDIDRLGFWDAAARVVGWERNRSVLDSFVAGVLRKLVWHGAAREVATLVLPLAQRWPAEDDRNAKLRRHLVQMTLQFWLQFGFEDARTQVEAWMAAPLENVEEVRHAILWFRGLYTAGLRNPDDTADTAKRRIAVALTTEAVRQAAEHLNRCGDLAGLDVSQEARARAAVAIVDAACQELYFGSGAYQGSSQDGEFPPMTQAAGRTFLTENTPTLRRIGQHGGAHTLYELLQILEHLIPTEPACVFDLFAAGLLQGGRSIGLEFESLAVDLVARVVGLYLADHRDVFDEARRREALVGLLETFVTAGWPQVRRLFYRLPDLLR